MRLTGALIILFTLSCVPLTGQQVINGLIVDAVTGKPVEYAQILNHSLQRQIYSNRNGQFRLQVREGDTLVMYALGYYYGKAVVNERILSEDTVRFSLRQQAYELSAAKILGIGDYEDFRNKLIHDEPPKTRAEKLNESLSGAILSAAMEGYQAYKNAHPVIAAVPIYTPEERERLRLSAIIKKEQVKDQVYQKFNPMIVKEITKMTNDDDIIDFMVFCHFTDNWLLEVNTYELSEIIAAKYELFRKKKEEEKLKKDPMNFREQPIQPFA